MENLLVYPIYFDEKHNNCYRDFIGNQYHQYSLIIGYLSVGIFENVFDKNNIIFVNAKIINL